MQMNRVNSKQNSELLLLRISQAHKRLLHESINDVVIHLQYWFTSGISNKQQLSFDWFPFIEWSNKDTHLLKNRLKFEYHHHHHCCHRCLFRVSGCWWDWRVWMFHPPWRPRFPPRFEERRSAAPRRQPSQRYHPQYAPERQTHMTSNIHRNLSVWKYILIISAWKNPLGLVVKN